MKIEIKSRWDGAGLFAGEYLTLKDAVEAAVKQGASLAGANLAGASLAGANLAGAEIIRQYAKRTITPEGNLIGWKKLRDGTICRLLVPTDAKRVGGMIGRKCRAEFVRVLDGTGRSDHAPVTDYAPGKIVKPDSYDGNPMVECSNGIHFFITREEAEAYEL